HFPQGRHIAQLANLLDDQSYGEVDVFGGGVAAQRKANRAMRKLVAAPQRAQDIRWLKAGRGAGRAAGYGKPLERHKQRLAFDVAEAEVQIMRHALIQAAVQIDLVNTRQTCPQAITQDAYALVLVSHLKTGQPEGFAHAHNLVDRKSVV